MKPTIVTSLYNINRETLDGRNWSEYIIWFSNTLRLNSPMVIFVDDEQLIEVINNVRGNLPTKIIKSPLESSYYYKFKDTMDSIIDSEHYKNKIKGNTRIECRSSLYNIIQYSKFYWVEKSADLNFFNTDLFLWIDAGISRFFESIDLEQSFTSEKIPDMRNKIFLQIFMQSYPDLSFASDLDEEYLSDERSYVAGGIFLIHKDTIKKVKEMVDDVLVNKMLNNSILNNEQICLGYLIKKHPDLFYLFRHYQHIHRNYEILNFLQ